MKTPCAKRFVRQDELVAPAQDAIPLPERTGERLNDGGGPGASAIARETGEMNAISITEPNALRLVQELALREGKSELEVIVEAVAEKLERPGQSGAVQNRKAYWLTVGRQNRLSIPADRRTLDVDQMLYDEAGLPQ